MKRRSKKTPIRSSLKKASSLHSEVKDGIGTVIKKKKAAKEQLAGHLRPGARITTWLWVASGRVHFADTEKARRRLDQQGIQFIGREVLAKHLPATKT